MQNPKKLFLFLCFLLLQKTILSTKFNPPEKMIIKTLVTDISVKPEECSINYKKTDGIRESQAFLGEHILASEQEGNWIKAEFLEQKIAIETKANKITWKNLLGWIKKENAITVKEFPIYNIVTKTKWTPIYNNIQKEHELLNLPMGIKLTADKIDSNWWKIYLPDGSQALIESNNICPLDIEKFKNEKTLRKNLADTAEQFVDDPYLWKGRSVYGACLESPATGVDCAGLINLVYRANGLEIPRNPHCQYLKSNKISEYQLKKGDLIFWAIPNNKEKVVHTMMYIGKNKIIESPRVNSLVRIADFEKRVSYHIKIGRIVSYFGSFINSQEKVKELQLAAITDQYLSENDLTEKTSNQSGRINPQSKESHKHIKQRKKDNWRHEDYCAKKKNNF